MSKRSSSPAPSSSTDATAYPFTCLACGIAFSLSEQQRHHHSSDWHKYNLKRKMNNLPSVGAQEFQQKVSEKKITISGPVAELLYKCVPCGKQYTSENAYIAHTQSKKHLEIADGVVIEAEIVEKKKRIVKKETLEDKKKIKVDITDCLFCPFKFNDIEKVVDHMVVDHEFNFPDLEYLVDIRGLLTYLAHKVKIGYGCLWCHTSLEPLKGVFKSVIDVQHHMRDLGHCKIKFEDQQWSEYSPFYDFSSMEDLNKVTVDPSTNELILEDGKRIGNRSWHKYYKQHYSFIQDTQVTKEVKKPAEKPFEFKKPHNDWRLKLGVKANSQKHFREQIL